MRSETDLIVIGAGPKAAALAAKAHVLNRLGVMRVSLTIIEADQPGSFWLGASGFTTGREALSTSPAKDVGFPYQGRRAFGDVGDVVDRAVTEFSWQRYLMAKGSYQRWVDAGAPPVEHREYGQYIAWVLGAATHGVQHINGRVIGVGLERETDKWRLEIECAAKLYIQRSRGLVLTGPGVHRELAHSESARTCMFHCDSRRSELDRIPRDKPCNVAIVGGGESAIACLTLLRTTRPEIRITVYTPSLPMSRAESFLENRVYSDPASCEWGLLSSDIRREFVKRCDRGVFAPHQLSTMGYDDQCRFITGRVVYVDASDGGQLRVEYAAGDKVESNGHDYLINCTGFDLLEQLRRLLSEDARAEVEHQSGLLWEGPPNQDIAVGRFLEIEGMYPLLHVPGLAAVSQGPGFANLSCLGLLADRILQAQDPVQLQTTEREDLVERC